MSSLEDKGLVPPGASLAARSSGAATEVHQRAADMADFLGGMKVWGNPPIIQPSVCLEHAADLLVLLAERGSLIGALDQAALEIEEAANVIRAQYPNLATVFDMAARSHRALVAKATGQEITAERDELAREGSVSK